jgi:hypothetical protein
MTAYEKKTFGIGVIDGADTLTLSKSGGTDWAILQMITNRYENGTITLRSKEIAVQLHCMLGQMLADT